MESSSIRWPKLAGAALLLILTLAVFNSEYGRLPLLGEVDLAIHEFGHLLFQPFGETMTILGGSLWQVVMPLLFAGYFFWPRKDAEHRPDPVGGIVCLWWSALNLLDVSIYVADARAGQLMMLTGETASEGSEHDWRNLLGGWGLMHRDLIYAGRMRAAAFVVAIICVGVIAWRGLIAPDQRRNAEVAEGAEHRP